MTVCLPCRTAAMGPDSAVMSLHVFCRGGPVTSPTTKDLARASMDAAACKG